MRELNPRYLRVTQVCFRYTNRGLDTLVGFEPTLR